MKRERAFQWALFLILTMALAACAPVQSGRMESAHMEIERPSTSIASVSKADAFLENGHLVVTGNLRRMHEVKLPGHVDIAVYGPEGELLGKKSVSVHGLSSNRKGAMTLPFRVRLELHPPPGSKAVVKYRAPFIDEDVFNGA